MKMMCYNMCSDEYYEKEGLESVMKKIIVFLMIVIGVFLTGCQDNKLSDGISASPSMYSFAPSRFWRKNARSPFSAVSVPLCWPSPACCTCRRAPRMRMLPLVSTTWPVKVLV